MKGAVLPIRNFLSSALWAKAACFFNLPCAGKTHARSGVPGLVPFFFSFPDRLSCEEYWKWLILVYPYPCLNGVSHTGVEPCRRQRWLQGKTSEQAPM
ncbi:hypothetical protein BDQ94DRAFT_152467 [Aspergillus welwitschiae]|uniref:Uncharacterized protein n=1 Tax=Aspergillus welwitschiae TaxID=1341132 RepID=A0A3F3PMY8_9EURO|nr:hypothetical protein BDQ94DRAFT_152467 [Aspergillus welwitschiae]RDH28287.1 hypothetical protein BDQ94DRAFT_152467 [Aspergillus welwitschiae]